MKPCRKCGGNDRTSYGACRICDRERRVAYRAANKEAIKANRDKWREKNKEKLLEQGRAWLESNKEKMDVWFENWRESNREKCRSLSHKHRKFTYVPCEAIVKQNKEHFKSADVVRKFVEQQGACAYCGIDVVDDYHIDHIVPVSKGGTNDAGNIQVLCPTCNGRKGAKLEEEFFEYARQKNYEVRPATRG